MKLYKLIVLGCLIFFSQSVYAYQIGCGYYISARQGICLTSLYPSEFGTYKQVAVRVTNASGATYNFGGSGWGLARAHAEVRYPVPYPVQVHTISGRHCVQYFNDNYTCGNISHSAYF